MFYVTTTDKFMSGWGHAKGKVNKLIFPCDTLEQAKIVAQNARNRTDQKNVNICSNRPYYNKARYYAQVKTIKDYPAWFEAGYFKPSNR